MIALNEQSGFGAPDFVESQRKKINNPKLDLMCYEKSIHHKD
jgi:hypothetical protein